METPSKVYLEYGYLKTKPFYRETWFVVALAAASIVIIIMVVAILCVKSKTYKYKGKVCHMSLTDNLRLEEYFTSGFKTVSLLCLVSEAAQSPVQTNVGKQRQSHFQSGRSAESSSDNKRLTAKGTGVHRVGLVSDAKPFVFPPRECISCIYGARMPAWPGEKAGVTWKPMRSK